MKKVQLLLMVLTICVSGMLFNSCKSDKVISSSFIQKRKYTKGFFVDLNNKKKIQTISSGASALNEKQVIEKAVPISGSVSVPEVQRTLAANTENSIREAVKTKQNEKTLVVSSSPKQIITEKSSIYKVPNGYVADNFYTEFASENNQYNQSTTSSTTHGGEKSWIAALLLCFFLGGLGIHRFYLGYTWQGIVQLLTLGGCGIWALIDLIRIIVKDLKPKDGDYND